MATMKNSQLKLFTMARNTFHIRRGKVSTISCFLYISFFQMELFKVNLQIFSLLTDSEFRCRFLIFIIIKVDIRMVLGNFEVNRKLSF